MAQDGRVVDGKAPLDDGVQLRAVEAAAVEDAEQLGQTGREEALRWENHDTCTALLFASLA